VGTLRPIRLVTLAGVVALLILPGSVLAATPGASPTAREATVASGPAAAASPSPPTSAAEARLAQVEATLRERDVPFDDAHLPNILGARPGRTGVVAPTYGAAPAPMGVADLGIANTTGTIVPSVLSTTSVEGVANITSAESVYLDGDGPGMYGVQLNAVATHVELFGHARYEFWAQDFFSYTPSNGTLTLGDNVWNLSSAAGTLSANALYSHGPNGTLVAPVFYYATGPTFTVHYPFVVTLLLSSFDAGKRPAIDFNYTVTWAGGSVSGSFDQVVFNSAKLLTVVSPFAPVPQFEANGTGVDPYGLPNDLELVLVGDGDGDTTTFVAVDAEFSLLTWNATVDRYVGVRRGVGHRRDERRRRGLLPHRDGRRGRPRRGP